MSDADDMREVKDLLVEMMASMTGPVADAIRSQMAAMTDGLIDARARMLAAGWEEWMVMEVMHSMLGARGKLGVPQPPKRS